MKVLVTGGRFYNNPAAVAQALFDLLPSLVIHGACRGADTLADRWAEANGIPRDPWPVTPQEWDRIGNAAGHRRNERMLKGSMPDVVLAFPGGKGTAGMKKLALAAGVRVIEIGAG